MSSLNSKMRAHSGTVASTTKTDKHWIAITLLLVAGLFNGLWTYSSTALTLSRSMGSIATSITPTRTVMEQIGAEFARVFPVHSNFSWYTNEGYKRNKDERTRDLYKFESPKGLLYVKVPKAASSTAASVMNRISHNHGNCAFVADHVNGKYYGNRDKSASFLLGSIRDPASRAISRIFFYHVSQKNKEPTDQNVLKWLNTTNGQYGAVSEGQGGFQLRYLSLDPLTPGAAWNAEAPEAVNNADLVHQQVQQIIEGYDFVIVVERMDESLVVLQMLLGIDIGDILTLDSKVQGMYSYSNRRCFKSVKSHKSPCVEEYLTSSKWYAQNYGDIILHAAANTSLDKTIDALGRTRVEEAVEELKRLKSLANEKCASRAMYPCSREGEKQLEKAKESCYAYGKDFGCGHHCIDDMLQIKAESRA